MAAFNYMIQAPDMGQQAWAGFERGFALNEAQRKRQAEEQQAQALAAQQAENQRIQSEFYDKIARDESPNLADVMRYQQTLPPEQIKAMQSTFDQLPKQAQQAELSFGAQALAAIKSGQFDTAKGIFQQKADAARNGGNEQLARYFEGMVRTVDVAPNAAASSIMTQMAVVPGGKEAIDSVLKVNAQPSEIASTEATTDLNRAKAAEVRATTPWTIANLKSQIEDRANRYGLDRDRLQSEVEMKLMDYGQKPLPESSQKIVNESAIGAVTANQSAARSNDLAGRLEALGGGYGAFGGMAEWWAKSTGNQDAMSQARTEYVALRNKLAQGSLPPGPATDKDVELVMKGFPPETADAKYLAKFLRAQANIQAAEAAFEDTKAQWVNEVGFLGKPKKDVVIGGVRVPAGTTLAEFWAKNGGGMTKKQNAASAMSRYSKYATEGQ
jgi:hypothetical protein